MLEPNKEPDVTTFDISASIIGIVGRPVKPKGIGRRHFTAIMLFLGMANAYVMRTNMSVAIVAMTDPLRSDFEKNIEWTGVVKGLVLSSFFYGYVLTQVPIGLITKKYDAKKLLGWGMVINGVFALLVPLSSNSFWSLVFVRFFQGTGEGPIVPCTHAMLAKWIPPGERSFWGGIVYSGAQFGTIISYPVSGFLAHKPNGWKNIFYIFGIICLIWCILFLTLVEENPSIDKRSSQEEKDYILNSIFGGDIIEGLKQSETPWHDIFRSAPFLSILMAHIGQNFGYETLMTMLPTFLSSRLHYDLIDNGLISATPYVTMFFTSCVFNYVADNMIQRKVASPGTTRKIMNSIGQFGPGAMFIILSLGGFPKTNSIVFIILAMGFNGAIYSGFKINHIDISPCFAGILMSITNCSANVVGMCAPVVCGFLLSLFEEQKAISWQIIFLISAVSYIVCATVFLFFSSGHKQFWDKKTSRAIRESHLSATMPLTESSEAEQPETLLKKEDRNHATSESKTME